MSVWISKTRELRKYWRCRDCAW